MFTIVLRFSKNSDKAGELMPAHDAWVTRGLAEGVQDPFVAHDVVRAELLEVSCSKADPRLGFLLG